MSRSDFITQLQSLGYQIEELGGNRLCFCYVIPVGKFMGQEICLGFLVGDDFPVTPPSGPHVSPRLLPLNTTSKSHPDGGIHDSKDFGPDWEYWSRPFPKWAGTDRTVKTYMGHIRRLFDTQ